jgi:hypothetical protein
MLATTTEISMTGKPVKKNLLKEILNPAYEQRENEPHQQTERSTGNEH